MATTTTAVKKNKKALTCSVITRNGPILRSIKIDHVEIPSHDGYVSIHLDHCPYIVRIGYGELKIYNEDNKLINMYVEDGIAEVTNNVIGILVETALYPKDIDAAILKDEINKLSSQMVINAEEARRNNEKIAKLNKQIEISSK
ncbi:F0F1 ATP synthase subunit epsilon [Brachyspira hyodysenteriae]|uniref:F0F1 ATP synthase subunit epsilon n=1 Tax=Brachyspira hyodysenteriae TaxID=159 RepID=UPI00063DD71E|nr:F0F1 ATP synthase subunit epsilon [Brachyspira hyodysenteriae]KLI40257.1 ATP synthase F0F1 subunit epsilon [Brachyspira hyodysenteriae]KLI59557.1 ATP synthase F0F1 subunit epsilon [Brachyspira hyodysenteriae]MCZ9839251.1 F0F1 ATP synthase subunit epsilon [Brachyspira hyodysenteriae]MCZ9846900.1 F0F1 ATP synthase subunit epsilon [Brachyspira hyodysenteriae]MCZ9850925.1 F0F1 ATP synthase subunit epsilon [Brachyspira hyodysenteriae]